MRSAFIIITALTFGALSTALPSHADEIPGKDRPLAFNTQGEFKIVQFTDLHLNEGSSQDGRTLKMIGEILDIEKPQLVVLTGDVLAGAKQQQEKMKQCAQPMAERQIPWAMVLGNHDDEGNGNRRGVMDIVIAQPYSIAQHGPTDVSGIGNYYLPVVSADGTTTEWVLYFLDSNAYPPRKSLGSYDWIKTDQVAWYRNLSKSLTQKNGGKPHPALAFFHIPLPEYEQVLTDPEANLVGNQFEPICCPRINSGFFAAMLECGDIKGTFVGHDHVNDYEATLHGIRLIYGRGTGFNAYGRDGYPRGGRVILIEAGKDNFTTWLRLEDGSKLQYN